MSLCAALCVQRTPQAAPYLAECGPALAELAAAQRMLPCWTVMAQLAEPAQLGLEAAFVNHSPQQQ